jgi:hypothetical protein
MQLVFINKQFIILLKLVIIFSFFLKKIFQNSVRLHIFEKKFNLFS